MKRLVTALLGITAATSRGVNPEESSTTAAAIKSMQDGLPKTDFPGSSFSEFNNVGAFGSQVIRDEAQKNSRVAPGQAGDKLNSRGVEGYDVGEVDVKTKKELKTKSGKKKSVSKQTIPDQTTPDLVKIKGDFTYNIYNLPVNNQGVNVVLERVAQDGAKDIKTINDFSVSNQIARDFEIVPINGKNYTVVAYNSESFDGAANGNPGTGSAAVIKILDDNLVAVPVIDRSGNAVTEVGVSMLFGNQEVAGDQSFDSSNSGGVYQVAKPIEFREEQIKISWINAGGAVDQVVIDLDNNRFVEDPSGFRSPSIAPVPPSQLPSPPPTSTQSTTQSSSRSGTISETPSSSASKTGSKTKSNTPSPSGAPQPSPLPKPSPNPGFIVNDINKVEFVQEGNDLVMNAYNNTEGLGELNLSVRVASNTTYSDANKVPNAGGDNVIIGHDTNDNHSLLQAYRFLNQIGQININTVRFSGNNDTGFNVTGLELNKFFRDNGVKNPKIKPLPGEPDCFEISINSVDGTTYSQKFHIDNENNLIDPINQPVLVSNAKSKGVDSAVVGSTSAVGGAILIVACMFCACSKFRQSKISDRSVVPVIQTGDTSHIDRVL